LAVVTLVALGLPQLQARESKKKDEEAKGKIPEEVRKRIQEHKYKFGAVLIEVASDGASQEGHEKTDGEGGTIMLEEGDIITHIDGKEVKTAEDFYKLMKGDKEKKLTVIDKNTDQTVSGYFKPKEGKLGVKFEVIATVG
jgi:PDZ domain-containing secreted protein